MKPVLQNILSARNSHPRDANIQFFEEGHKYIILTEPNVKYTSVTTWNHSHFEKFDAARKFRKWALTEVTSLDSIPEGMEAFHLPAGAYACFHYIGNSNDASVFEKIFREWLPASEYVLDDRPHFEILGDRYKQGDPNSEETIWIPIKKKE
jgi:AraC family transcriptional regulator